MLDRRTAFATAVRLVEHGDHCFVPVFHLPMPRVVPAARNPINLFVVGLRLRPRVLNGARPAAAALRRRRLIRRDLAALGHLRENRKRRAQKASEKHYTNDPSTDIY